MFCLYIPHDLVIRAIASGPTISLATIYSVSTVGCCKQFQHKMETKVTRQRVNALVREFIPGQKLAGKGITTDYLIDILNKEGINVVTGKNTTAKSKNSSSPKKISTNPKKSASPKKTTKPKRSSSPKPAATAKKTTKSKKLSTPSPKKIR